MLAALLVAFVLSFLGSMPIAGPISVLVVTRSLAGKSREGFFIAAGAAVSEAVYAGLAFAGLTAMLERYPVLVPLSRMLGCLLLAGIGAAFLLRRPTPATDAPPASQKPEPATAVGGLLVGLGLTAVNPTLLITWTAAVSAAHGTGFLRVNPLDAVPFAAGVFAGILAWFAILLTLLGRFRRRLRPAMVDRVLRVMGIALLVAGVGLGVRTALRWNVIIAQARSAQ